MLIGHPTASCHSDQSCNVLLFGRFFALRCFLCFREADPSPFITMLYILVKHVLRNVLRRTHRYCTLPKKLNRNSNRMPSGSGFRQRTVASGYCMFRIGPNGTILRTGLRIILQRTTAAALESHFLADAECRKMISQSVIEGNRPSGASRHESLQARKKWERAARRMRTILPFFGGFFLSLQLLVAQELSTNREGQERRNHKYTQNHSHSHSAPLDFFLLNNNIGFPHTRGSRNI